MRTRIKYSLVHKGNKTNKRPFNKAVSSPINKTISSPISSPKKESEKTPHVKCFGTLMPISSTHMSDLADTIEIYWL